MSHVPDLRRWCIFPRTRLIHNGILRLEKICLTRFGGDNFKRMNVEGFSCWYFNPKDLIPRHPAKVLPIIGAVDVDIGMLSIKLKADFPPG
jgi:hypothetical protein